MTQWIGGYHGPTHTRPPTAQQLPRVCISSTTAQERVEALRCAGCGASKLERRGPGLVCAYCGNELEVRR